MNLRFIPTLPRQPRPGHLTATTGQRDTSPAADRRGALATAVLASMRAERDHLAAMRAHPSRDARLRMLDRAITRCAAEITASLPLPADDLMRTAQVFEVAR